MWLKHLHVTCVLLSFLGFTLRGALSWHQVYRVKARWLRITPHVIDTLLLVSAVCLAFLWHIDPRHHPWLLTKLLLLPCYIGLGMLAMKETLAPHPRRLAWISALVLYLYMVGVAVTKNPFFVVSITF